MFKKKKPFDKKTPAIRDGRAGKDGRTKKDRKPRTSRIRVPAIKYRMAAGTKIDYKDFNLLQRYITDRGKILSRRITGLTAKQQRALTRSVKKARFLGLLSISPAARRQAREAATSV